MDNKEPDAKETKDNKEELEFKLGEWHKLTTPGDAGDDWASTVLLPVILDRMDDRQRQQYLPTILSKMFMKMQFRKPSARYLQETCTMFTQLFKKGMTQEIYGACEVIQHGMFKLFMEKIYLPREGQPDPDAVKLLQKVNVKKE